jgi:integrase
MVPGLQWKDIDLIKGIISIKQTLNRLKTYDTESKTKTTIVIGETKTLKSKRQIPLHQIMIKELRQYKLLQKQDKLKVGEMYNNDGFLITNEIGKPIEPRTYQYIFHRLMNTAGIAKGNFHCMSDTFATRALERGIPAKTVSEILGHSNISTNLDLYSHVSLDLKRDSIEKLADLFITNPVEQAHSDKKIEETSHVPPA